MSREVARKQLMDIKGHGSGVGPKLLEPKGNSQELRKPGFAQTKRQQNQPVASNTSLRFEDIVSAVETKSYDAMTTVESKLLCATYEQIISQTSILPFLVDKTIEHKLIKSVTQDIFRLFQCQKRIIPHILNMVRLTVLSAPDSATLMRTDSICTTIMTKYALEVVEPRHRYLRGVVGGVTDLLVGRVGSDWETSEKSILEVAAMYADAIFSHPEDVPYHLRIIAHFLKNQVLARDLGDGQTAIAGFLLLRAVVPTIVTPSLYDPSITIPKEIKEEILLASKLMQNLANKTFPRTSKLQYTQSFLQERQEGVKEFLHSVADIEKDFDSSEQSLEIQRPKNPLKFLYNLTECVWSHCPQIKEAFEQEESIFSQEEKTIFLAYIDSFPVRSPKVPRSPPAEDEEYVRQQLTLKNYIISTTSNYLITLDTTLSRKNLGDAISPIFSILRANPPLLPVLINFLKLTIARSPKPVETLRADNLLTSLLVKFALEIIEPETKYLTKMLGKLVEEVEERVKEERGEKELLMLELGSMFVNTIFGHPVAVPIQIRQLCTVLKEEGSKHKLDERSLVASFLLSRLIIPCIIRPSQFDSSLSPSQNATSYLMILSKIMQSLSTGTPPRSGNLQYAVPFIEKMQPKVKAFIDGVCTIDDTAIPVAQKIVSRDNTIKGTEGDLEAVLNVLLANRDTIVDALEKEFSVDNMELKAHFRSLKQKPQTPKLGRGIGSRTKKKSRPLSSMMFGREGTQGPNSAVKRIRPATPDQSGGPLSPRRIFGGHQQGEKDISRSKTPDARQEGQLTASDRGIAKTKLRSSGGGEKPSKHSFESLLSSSLSESIALAEKKQYKHPLLSLLDEAGERIKEEGKEKEKEKGEKREERTEISLGHARSPKIERKEEKEKEKERVILIEGDVVKREREVEKVTEILAVLKKSWPEESCLKEFSLSNLFAAMAHIIQHSPKPLIANATLLKITHSQGMTNNTSTKYDLTPSNLGILAHFLPSSHFAIVARLFPLLAIDVENLVVVVSQHPALQLGQNSMNTLQMLVQMFSD